MTWTGGTASFFAGMLLANAVPHFVHGISGDRFPTPFANPPGKGLSSATVNVIWALVNLAVGGLLFRVGRVGGGSAQPLLVFFSGITVMAIFSSVRFAGKHSS